MINKYFITCLITYLKNTLKLYLALIGVIIFFQVTLYCFFTVFLGWEGNYSSIYDIIKTFLYSGTLLNVQAWKWHILILIIIGIINIEV
jgi:hypothetical protein